MIDGTLPPANSTCEIDEPNPFILLGEMLKEANGTQS
jgi:hypothetical protein